MKKIKLKESDLTRIIERVISEQDTYTPMPEVGGPEIDEIEDNLSVDTLGYQFPIALVQVQLS